MTRAAIYARYSSHVQNDESIEQQLSECQDYAQAHDLQVVATYADRALSGRSDRRPEFQRMIRAAEAHDFSVVIAYKSNRIARNMLQALQYEARLDRCGVHVVYCREEFGDSATGRFMLRSMMNLNQFYSENMAEDILRGLNENAKQCRVNGLVPLGYKRGEDGRYQIDEATAPIVREIFTRLAAGETRAAIAADLNNRHIPTSTGNRWNKSSFASMTKNERYIGVYLFRDVRIEGGVPAILTKEQFEAVRDRIHRPNGSKARQRHPDMVYILTGKMYCGDCGEMMHGVSGVNAHGVKYGYYRCRGCKKARIRKDYIEDLVIRALRECVMDDATIDELVNAVMAYKSALEDRSEVDALTARLKETRTAKANVLRAIETGVVSSTLSNRLVELERDEADLDELIRRAQRKIPDITPDMVRFLFEKFRAGDVDDPAYHKLLINSFLNAVYVYSDHLDVCFSFRDGDGPPVRVPLTDGGGKVSIRAKMGHHLHLIQTICFIDGLFVARVPRQTRKARG